MAKHPIEHFGQRLKAARLMAGLSLHDLADRIGHRVTRQALFQYEKNGFKPDSHLITRICHALGIRPDFLLRQPGTHIENLEFRKLRSLPEKARRSLSHRASDLLGRYLELEELLHLPSGFTLNIRHRTIRTSEQTEQVAIRLREQMNLGYGPINNVIALLEDHHVKVVEIRSPYAFAGLSARSGESLSPIIVLNAAALPTPEEKRITALHELGHLVLNLEGLSKKDQELRCQEFAAALLLPKAAAVEIIGRKRRNLYLSELGDLKQRFGLPALAALIRLRDMGIIGRTLYQRLRLQLPDHSPAGKSNVWFPFVGAEESRRFRRLLLHALAEEIITMSKASAMAGMKLAEFRDTYLRPGA